MEQFRKGKTTELVVRAEKNIKESYFEGKLMHAPSDHSTDVSLRLRVPVTRCSCRTQACCGLNYCAISIFIVFGVILAAIIVVVSLGFATDIFKNDN